MGPGPKYEGKIVSFETNHKMACDVISFVSKPIKTNEGEMKYVLICQDIFSRKIYTRPMVELSQTTNMFEDILKEQELFDNENKYPDVLNSDKGGEFTSEAFKELCQRYNIRQVFKVGINDIATVDSAIAVLKRIIKRLENNKGGNWWSLLREAENIYNNTENSTTKAEPNEVNQDEDITFSLQKQAAKNLTINTKLIQKRKKKLEQLGHFRIHRPNINPGLKRRIDNNQWSKEIFEVNDFTKPGFVNDEFG